MRNCSGSGSRSFRGRQGTEGVARSVCSSGIDLLSTEPRAQHASLGNAVRLPLVSQLQDVAVHDNEIPGLADFDGTCFLLQIQHARSIDGVGIDGVTDCNALLWAERRFSRIAARDGT